MESQTLEFEGSGGVTLIADAWGDPDADPILFMHGGGQTRHSWGGAAELLAGKGWRTLSVDLRGHGDSGWFPNGDYEAVHFVADINAVLSQLAARRSSSVHLSVGGRQPSWSAMGHQISAAHSSWSISPRRSKRRARSASLPL